MKLTTIDVEIEGTTPLLCNRFTDQAQQSASSGTRGVAVGDRGTPLEQAESKLYVDHDNGDVIGIPQPNLFRMIIDAGTFFKNGKSKITTQKSSLIPACVEIPGVFIPLIHEQPWKVDTRPVRIPSTGGRILCHRPCFDDWKLRFEARVDTTQMSVKLFREVIDAAGLKVGLGDFRVACKGPFGKFVVNAWEVQGDPIKNGRAQSVAV